MKKPLFFLFLLFCFYAKAQDTAYYNSDWEKVSAASHPQYFKITKLEDRDSSGAAWEKTYEIPDHLINESHYSSFRKGTYTGKCRDWYSDGKLQHEIDYNSKGEYDGRLLSYYRNGQLKRDDTYSSGKLISGKCYSEQGTASDWYEYEQIPLYPGNEEALVHFIQKEVRYPRIASRHNVTGKVYMQFTVAKDGSLSNITVRKFEPTCRAPRNEKKYETIPCRLYRFTGRSQSCCQPNACMDAWQPGWRKGKGQGNTAYKVRIEIRKGFPLTFFSSAGPYLSFPLRCSELPQGCL